MREFIRYEPEDWLFPGATEGKHITERSVQKIFVNAREKAGIRIDVSVHTLRHYVESNIMGSEYGFPYILYF